MKDRLAILTEKLEAGDPITRADVDRVAALQQLDAARQVNEFLEETQADERRADEWLRNFLGDGDTGAGD